MPQPDPAIHPARPAMDLPVARPQRASERAGTGKEAEP